MISLAMILAPGFEESEAVVPADLIRRAGINLTIVGMEGYSVTGAHDITIEADCTLDELDDDVQGVFLPGGMPGSSNLAKNPGVISLVRRMHNDSHLIAAICAAPALVLGASGILSGRRFTCYPGMEKHVIDGEFREEAVVQDGNLITSRGVGTAGPFGLKIVEYLTDVQTAKKLGKATLIL